MKHINSAGGIVLNQNGHVLVVTNELGKITLPKGRPETGEILIQTAEREILEEGGLQTVTIHHKLGIIIRPGYTDENPVTPSVIKHIHMYFCTTTEMALNPIVKDIRKAEWIHPDEVSKILSWPEEAQFFEKHWRKLNSNLQS